jgi:hypothetical protein
MKKSTLIVVLIAAALGAFVYFYDSKRNFNPPSPEASWKPAFAVKPGDITGFTIANKSNPDKITFAKQGSTWKITTPVQTDADQAALTGIVSDLVSDKIERSFAPTGALSVYGLDHPAVTLDFDVKGTKHTLQLGDKDFSSSLVYAFVDGSKQIAMIPASLLDETNKPLLQLRDRDVLELNGADVSGLTLDDPSGKISLSKDTSGWKITAPRPVGGDDSAVDALVASLNTAKFTGVVSETSADTTKDAAKYGLAHPAITLDVTTSKGAQPFHLLIGKGTTKDTQDNYYARDASRPMIFQVDSALYTSLDKKFFDLRDKSILHLVTANISSIQVKNANGLIECTQGKDDQWTGVQPVANKGKTVQSWKFLDPLENTRATAIYDSPSPAILRYLAKPAIVVTLTDKSGKVTTVNVSPAVKDSVYVRTSAGPRVCQVSTQILKDLGFKPADLLL